LDILQLGSSRISANLRKKIQEEENFCKKLPKLSKSKLCKQHFFPPICTKMGYKVSLPYTENYFFKDFFWQKLVRISQKFIENVHEHYQNNYFRMAFRNISPNKFLYPDTLFVILIKCLKCDFLHEFYTLDLCIGKLNTIFSVGVVGLSSKNIEPIIVYLLTNPQNKQFADFFLLCSANILALVLLYFNIFQT